MEKLNLVEADEEYLKESEEILNILLDEFTKRNCDILLSSLVVSRLCQLVFLHWKMEGRGEEFKTFVSKFPEFVEDIDKKCGQLLSQCPETTNRSIH